jgi:hypothetical protein
MIIEIIDHSTAAPAGWQKQCKNKRIYSADHRNKKRKAFIKTFGHGKHGKIKALKVIFPCSSVDSVANGVLLLSLPWIGAVYL